MNEAVRLGDEPSDPAAVRRRGGRASRGAARRSQARLRAVPDPREQAEPIAQFDIRTLDGAEGKRLSAQQAQVLWEVTAWLAQNKS
ncbi:hypothetical protein [Nocardia wallacei]|nr:hypothetical protein [Nocardia wallacei]